MRRTYLYVERHIGFIFHKHVYTVQCTVVGYTISLRCMAIVIPHELPSIITKLIIKMSDVIESFLISLYTYSHSMQKQLISEQIANEWMMITLAICSSIDHKAVLYLGWQFSAPSVHHRRHLCLLRHQWRHRYIARCSPCLKCPCRQPREQWHDSWNLRLCTFNIQSSHL